MHRLFARLGIRHREHRSVARDFSIYSSVNIVSLVLLLGTGLILRKYLGLYYAGIWAALEVLPAYAQYAHLGVLNAAERDLPYLLGARKDDEFERMKHTLLWLSHGLGLLLSIALIAGALILRDRFSRPLFIGLLVYAPLLWAQILAAYYVVLYRSRKRFVALSGRQGVANLMKAMLTMAGGYAFGLYGVFAALLTASMIQVVLFHTGLDERFTRVFARGILRPMVIDGLPILLGGVAFETIRNADRVVIGATLGLEALGVYSVTQIICQGVFYVPNTLSMVMYPRFQERYGATNDVRTLRTFVELQLQTLADVLLAGTAVLLIALPPAIDAFLPQYVGTIPALRVMLVGTYLLCLTPPAGQLLLTVHKQVSALAIALPVTALALAAAYAGSRYGLVGVATGVSIACLVEFVGVNAYAFSLFAGPFASAKRLATIVGTLAIVVAATMAIQRVVPPGPRFIAVVGGWQLVAISLVSLPLLIRAARRIRTLQATPSTRSLPPDSVDNLSDDH